jgi:predicted kinase
MQPILFYTVGYPGAGKTTLAQNLANWFDGVHLRADKIGLKLFVVPTYSEAERVAVYQHMDYETMLALNSGKSVLYDGALNTAAQRERLQQLAGKHGVQAVGLWLTVPADVAKTRAGKLRDVGVGGIGGRIIPPELFERYKAAFERPNPEQEFYTVVDGLQPFGYQYRELRRKLRQHHIMLPQIVEL